WPISTAAPSARPPTSSRWLFRRFPTAWSSTSVSPPASRKPSRRKPFLATCSTACPCRYDLAARRDAACADRVDRRHNVLCFRSGADSVLRSAFAAAGGGRCKPHTESTAFDRAGLGHSFLDCFSPLRSPSLCALPVVHRH